MRPTAAKAALRPFQMTARSASSWATRISVRAVPAADLLDDAQVLAPPARSTPSSSVIRIGPCALGVAGVHGRLGGLDRQTIHHLDRGGQDARRHDVRHRATGLVGRVERRQERRDLLGPAHDAERDPHGDAECALRADERAEQVRTRLVEALAAELDELAVGQHDREPAHVVDREAVLEAVRAAGVLGHVAADRADLLARRIRRVEVAVGRDGAGDVEVRDAGLDDRRGRRRDRSRGSGASARPRSRRHPRRAARHPRGPCLRRARRTGRRRRGRRARRPARPRSSPAGRRAPGSPRWPVSPSHS